MKYQTCLSISETMVLIDEVKLLNLVYLGLGSNLGNKEEMLQTAIEKINERIGVVVSQSAFYITPPWGFESENDFLNAVVACETKLSPQVVLKKTQQIERECGRKRKSVDRHYEDRPLDIDILLYDDLVLKTDKLVIPHPLMHQRGFVLEPLNEIASGVVHPEMGKSIGELFKELQAH